MLFNKIDSLFIENKDEGKLLLITDDLADLSIEKVSTFIQRNNVQIYIYPFATQIGTIIPLTKELSILDQEKLNSLNAFEKVAVLDMTLDNSDVKDLALAISDDIVFDDKSEEEEENWQDRGYWFIFPLAFLFLFSFRKGWSLNILIITLTLSSCSEQTKEKTREFEFKDLLYTQAYQAQKEFDSGNYSEAAKGFEDPVRKGVAYFKAGDYISARIAFERDSTNMGLYNLGLTYAKLGELEKSREIFEQVLKRDPSNKNASSNLQHIITAISELGELKPEDVALNEDGERAKNEKNDSPEDLSGGGQEATEKDMQKERKEETVETEKRKGKELDELPEDFKSGQGELPKNILMRKVDDDPALFLTKKFRYQIKKKQVDVKTTSKKW